MSWLRIDDTFTDHPKVLRAGDDVPLVIALHLRAISYASRQLTDGFIPDYVVGHLSRDLDDAKHCWQCRSQVEYDADKWSSLMVKIGLWERVDSGFLIHDYLVYNRSRRQAAKERKDKEIAGRKGGLASGKQRASKVLRSASSRNGRPAEAPSPPVPLKDHPPTPQGGSEGTRRRKRREPTADEACGISTHRDTSDVDHDLVEAIKAAEIRRGQDELRERRKKLGLPEDAA